MTIWLARCFSVLGGRLTLINSVLASIPSYFMACFPWPKESIAKLESLLRAFFSQGKNSVKGGQCLVAWDYVSVPRDAGGLGVQNLTTHNHVLLCKFPARVLQSSDVPCYQWFTHQYCSIRIPHGSANKDTAIWKGFKECISLVTASTFCSLGEGQVISFWHDKW